MPNKLLFSERVIFYFTSIYRTGLEIYLLQIKIPVAEPTTVRYRQVHLLSTYDVENNCKQKLQITTSQYYGMHLDTFEARGGAGTALQADRSRLRFPMVSLT